MPRPSRRIIRALLAVVASALSTSACPLVACGCEPPPGRAWLTGTVTLAGSPAAGVWVRAALQTPTCAANGARSTGVDSVLTAADGAYELRPAASDNRADVGCARVVARSGADSVAAVAPGLPLRGDRTPRRVDLALP